MQITSPASLALQVRRKRKNLRLTLEQTALVSGVSLSFLRGLERGKETCQLAFILKVLGALGMTLNIDGAVLDTDVSSSRGQRDTPDVAEE